MAGLLASSHSVAGTCAQTSYTLNTQNAVEVLGNTGCNAVLGDLTVTGSGITSLATLSNITSIGGDLNVTSNTNLNYLDGLESLTSVTGAVTVNNNGSLFSICNLQNVTIIGGDLVVAANQDLENAECSWSLQTVGGNILFEDNPSIWTLSYLGGLTTHGGSLTIHNSMDQLYFGEDAPYALTEIGGDLVIEENGITNVDELNNLTSVGGSLTISGNNTLDDVDGLINLGSVGGILSVQSNATLGDCLGFVPLLGYPNGPDSVGGSVTFASNQSGCNSVADIFAGVQPPGQPTITGITAGDGQIRLTATVTEQGTFAITGYRGVCTDNQNNSFMSTATGSSVTVTGLTNGTAYTCTVVALSDGGESQASGESIPVTPEERPQVDPAVLWFLIKGSGYVEEESDTGGDSSGSNGGTGSDYTSACNNVPSDVDCRKLFGGDLSGPHLDIVSIADDTVLSIPFKRETATRPVSVRYYRFQSQVDYVFEASLSEQANGQPLSGGSCKTSGPYAESVLRVNDPPAAASGCQLPSGDGLVWLNFKFRNYKTGDLAAYEFRLSIESD